MKNRQVLGAGVFILSKYRLGFIQRGIKSLCSGSEKRAQLLGFKTLYAAQNIAKNIEATL